MKLIRIRGSMLRNLTLLLIVFGTAVCAHANPVEVTLRLDNVSPYNNDYAYYVYPYNFNINGAAPTSLLCDDFNDEIYMGETWKAYRYTIANILGGAGQMSPATGSNAGWVPGSTNPTTEATQRKKAYEDAAWLFLQLSMHPSTSTNPADVKEAVDINHAIWGIFTHTPYNDSSNSYHAGVAYWSALATAHTSLYANDQAAINDLGNVAFYTPEVGTQRLANGSTTSDRPQEFLGIYPTPEPSTLALLGIGLVGLQILRRKQGFAKGSN